MKNILIINHYAGSQQMGMEFRPYYFAREWIKMGYRVDIIAADYSHLRIKNPVINKDFQEEVIDGIHYHWVHTVKYNGNGVKRAVTMFQFVGKIITNANRIARELKPDVIITSSTYPLDTYAGQKIKRCVKKYDVDAKVIHEVHDMWPATLIELGGMSPKHPFIKIIQLAEDNAYKNSDNVVSLPPFAEEYMRHHGLAEGKFLNIQNGICLDEWKNVIPLPKNIEDKFRELHNSKKFIVGYFGGHALSNSLDALLDSAKSIKENKNIIFVLVGKGVEKDNLIKRCKKENIQNVIFFDAVDKRCIPNLLKHFDCIYIGTAESPLYRFGLSLNKLYDSMMAGKYILLSTTAVNTLVEQYRCGTVVGAHDTNAISKEIIRISKLKDDLRSEIGNRGRKAILDSFTYDKLAQKFAMLF